MYKHFKLLSLLLLYPEQDLLDSLPELKEHALGQPLLNQHLLPLFDYLAEHELIVLQEHYVSTFDRNPAHSLHLFEHIHGESRDRGQAMVDLLKEYLEHGLAISADELPDYVPLFLEFLTQLDTNHAERLLGDAIHVLVHIGNKLSANNSPYAVVFDVLQSLSPVTAVALSEPPIRSMDEALEVFGPGADGVEPLLTPSLQGAKPINFYPRPPRTAQNAAC